MTNKKLEDNKIKFQKNFIFKFKHKIQGNFYNLGILVK